MASEEQFTLGVEEEYQIVDARTRQLRPRAKKIMPQAERELGENVQHELQLSQIEIATPVCKTLAEVRAELVRSRRAVIKAAGKDGDKIAAAGTHPFSEWEAQAITPKDRYLDMARDYQQIARELVIFGCHVHVSLADAELGVAVMNRARVWLAPLLALSANSPFWLGADTGYASFRTEMWGRWPMAGPPQLFESRQEHDALVKALVATGSISDMTKVYWDIRLPERVPTIEFRIADVCLTVDEAIMLAGLVRGLVKTCYAEAAQNTPFPRARPELLRAAHWRAARYGLEKDLIDVAQERAVPAPELVQTLLDWLRPQLEASDDWEEVSGLVEQTLTQGNGAARQRAVYKKTNSLEAVVDYITVQTAQGVV